MSKDRPHPPGSFSIPCGPAGYMEGAVVQGAHHEKEQFEGAPSSPGHTQPLFLSPQPHPLPFTEKSSLSSHRHSLALLCQSLSWRVPRHTGTFSGRTRVCCLGPPTLRKHLELFLFLVIHFSDIKRLGGHFPKRKHTILNSV